MNFNDFDKELEVFSDEEGVTKGIHGWVYGKNRGVKEKVKK